MKVELLDITPDPECKIGSYASICYDSDTDRDANIRRARSCKDRGHLATMRFAYATFKISDISRVCSHQLVRMAHAGILQQSQRYVKLSNIEYVEPPNLASIDFQLHKEWLDIQERASKLYATLIEGRHLHQQEARYILPQSVKTEIIICLNFQGFKDFLRNRDTKAADWEIRGVAAEVRRKLVEHAPGLF